jgi:hypothetical protein
MSLAAFAVAFFALAAAGSSYYRPNARAVVAAALRMPELKHLGPSFPRQPGGRRCRDNLGGPAPGASVPRICWTIVTVRGDGSTAVTFMRSIPFAGRKEIGETWTYRVSRSLQVRLVRKPKYDQLPGGEA